MSSTNDYVPTPKTDTKALKRKKEEIYDVEAKEKRLRTDDNTSINSHINSKIDFEDNLTESDYAIVKQINKVNNTDCPEKIVETGAVIDDLSEVRGISYEADKIEDSAGNNKYPMESQTTVSKEEDKSSTRDEVIKKKIIAKEKMESTIGSDKESRKASEVKESKENDENKDVKKKSSSSHKKKSHKHHSDRDKKSKPKKSEKESDKNHEREKSRDKKRSSNKSEKSESKSTHKKEEKTTVKSKTDCKSSKPKRIISHEELFGDSSSDNETIVCLRDTGKNVTPNVTDAIVSTAAKKNDSLSTQVTQFSDNKFKHRIAHAGADKASLCLNTV